MVSSRVRPDLMRGLIWLPLFSALYLAMNLVRAGLVPHVWNRPRMVGRMKAMEIMPYSSGVRSLTTRIVPTADVAVETVCPMKRWRLPLAVVLAISVGELNKGHAF